jgi:hypothetical protein
MGLTTPSFKKYICWETPNEESFLRPESGCRMKGGKIVVK